MALSKEKKSDILNDLKKIVKDSASLVFVNFRGLPVSETRQIRKGLSEKGIGFVVAKKSLAKKVITDAHVEGTMPEIPGEFGFAYGTDLLDPAREIFAFQKQFDKKITIVGGVFDGKFMSQSEMVNVANIPGLKTLQAQFVNLINSPIQGLVIALNGIAEKKA